MEITRIDGPLESQAPSVDSGDSDPSEVYFARMFEDCRPHLMRRCRRILNDHSTAEDVVSDTYVRAYEHQAQFDGRNFSGWLVRIAENLCIDRIRHGESIVRIRAAHDLEKPLESAGTDTEMRFLNAAQIRAVLSKLPEAQRLCLKLFYIEGFTAKEVAQRTQFTDHQVKSYLQNGRRNFIRLWKALERNE